MSSATAHNLQILDLTDLHEMTGGDRALEEVLFSEFIRAGHGFIADLRAQLAADQAEAWRRTAHAFKGIALNLGAEALGERCKQAQLHPMASREEKQAMLAEIESAFADVIQRLQP